MPRPNRPAPSFEVLNADPTTFVCTPAAVTLFVPVGGLREFLQAEARRHLARV